MSGTEWEKSKTCTPLKRDILRAFFGMPHDFFLTGGSALGIFYLDHRHSYDMDFFSLRDVDWHRLANDLTAISRTIGAQLNNLQMSPHFARYEMKRGEEKELLDFVHELVPQIHTEKNRFDEITVDTLDEIVVNKWCALQSRVETKDIIDLYFLSKKTDIRTLFPRAREKEGGINPSMMSYTLSLVSIESLPEYLVSKVSVDDLKGFIRDTCAFLNTCSFPER